MGNRIRIASPCDAEAISSLIIRALRESNAKDYPPSVIARVQQGFDPEAILLMLVKRRVLVAENRQTVLGTGSLDGDMIRSVYVDPAHQGQGIGRLLMAELERAAIAAGVERLKVPSSLTAEGFYTRLGFRAIREITEGEERTIVMERGLGA